MSVPFSPEAVAPGSSSQDLQRQPLRILLADDEAGLRALFGELFAIHHPNHVVQVVADGRAAIAALAAGTFDLLFTDLQMPHATGIDVIHAAREFGVPRQILASGRPSAEVHAALSASFGDDHAVRFLQKPPRVQEVFAVLDA